MGGTDPGIGPQTFWTSSWEKRKRKGDKGGGGWERRQREGEGRGDYETSMYPFMLLWVPATESGLGPCPQGIYKHQWKERSTRQALYYTGSGSIWGRSWWAQDWGLQVIFKEGLQTRKVSRNGHVPKAYNSCWVIVPQETEITLYFHLALWFMERWAAESHSRTVCLRSAYQTRLYLGYPLFGYPRKPKLAQNSWHAAARGLSGLCCLWGGSHTI